MLYQARGSSLSGRSNLICVICWVPFASCRWTDSNTGQGILRSAGGVASGGDNEDGRRDRLRGRVTTVATLDWHANRSWLALLDAAPEGTSIDLAAVQRYRLGLVRSEMAERDIAAVVLSDPVSIRYATGTRNMQVFSVRLAPCSAVPVAIDGTKEARSPDTSNPQMANIGRGLRGGRVIPIGRVHHGPDRTDHGSTDQLDAATPRSRFPIVRQEASI